MDLRKQNQDEESAGEIVEKFQVRDTFHILVVSSMAILVYGFSIMSLLKSRSTSGILIGGVLFMIVLAFIVARVRAIWNGVEFDLSERIISFPGGGLNANSISDYFNPKFLLQYFQRIIIDIDDLQGIRKSKKWAKTLRGIFFSKYSDKEVLIGVLHLSGSFGDAYVKFESVQKCNQAYTNLAYHLKMGEPVVVR